jgi:hypothetical protein
MIALENKRAPDLGALVGNLNPKSRGLPRTD